MKHHEEGEAFQEQFKLDMEGLLVTMREYGNPFSEDSTDTLVVLHNGNLKTGKSVENLSKIEEVGEKTYEAFMKDSFVERTASISKTIPTNNFFIFNTETNRGKKQQQVTCLKNDVSLFSRLFIACQNQDGDLDNFFQYENQDYPLSISIFNELRYGNKADSPILSELPQSDMVIIDGAAIVNALKPDPGMTFKDYAANKFIPRISKLLSNVKRIDIVFDVYLENFFKITAHLHRGQGSRKCVRDNYKVPFNWKSFLCHSENKNELFSFLSDYGHENFKSANKTVVFTLGSVFLCTPEQDTSSLEPCNHEEADTRIFLYMKDGLDRQVLHRVLIYTVDTDVIVLAVSAVAKLNNLNLSIAFGTGTHFRYLNVKNLANSISHYKADVLPMFHAITGCDTIFFFAGKGKISAMDTWSVYTDFTEALSALLANPGVPRDEELAIIEQYFVYLYDRSSEASMVNAARLDLFRRKGHPIESIPPTRGALIQHILHSICQVSCWEQMFQKSQKL